VISKARDGFMQIRRVQIPEMPDHLQRIIEAMK
jgi:hypothetical protein